MDISSSEYRGTYTVVPKRKEAEVLCRCFNQPKQKQEGVFQQQKE